MNRTLIAALRTLLAHPDRPDRDMLFAALDDDHDNDHASEALACLAPLGSLLQIAAALDVRWSWTCDRWERQIDNLVEIITDPRCPHPGRLIETWSTIPSAVGALCDRTDTLIAWAQQRFAAEWCAELAVLLGPSDESARLLMRSPFLDDKGRTLRRWSMETDPGDPTAWQAMIENPDLRAALHQKADPSRAFPAWGWDDAVDSGIVLREIVDDLANGWSPDHPSLRGRIVWIESRVDSNLDVGDIAVIASIGRSDPIVEAVCACRVHDPFAVYRIAETVPWSRLHPRIQTVINETMQHASDVQWASTWVCALGQAPVERGTIDADLLIWRIDPERWNALDWNLRDSLVAYRPLPHHCFGWGITPDLVGQWSVRNGQIFHFWNPDVPPDDLRAWAYADLLRAQSTLQDARVLIALLAGLPPDCRPRFEQIIDWRLGDRFRAITQSPWDWVSWAEIPTAAARQSSLQNRLAGLWGERDTPPAARLWRARFHLVDTVAVAVRALLDSRRAPRILAALLAQIPALQVHMPNPGPPLPFPNNLDAALRAQVERLPLARDAQAYAAWCLWLLARAGDVGSDLIALHPDVAVVLAPLLSLDQQKAVAASPAAQGWDSMTQLRWTATCETTEGSIPPRIQRRIR